MAKKKDRPLVVAFGFDKAGFTIPDADIEADTYVIRHLPYRSEESLEIGDAFIVPNGIFERIENQSSISGSYQTVQYDEGYLAD